VADDPTDLQRAYLLGIKDGFRLARAQTQPEAEDLCDEIRTSMDARLRDVRAAWDQECKLDRAEAAEHDLKGPLN